MAETRAHWLRPVALWVVASACTIAAVLALSGIPCGDAVNPSLFLCADVAASVAYDSEVFPVFRRSRALLVEAREHSEPGAVGSVLYCYGARRGLDSVLAELAGGP